MTLRPAARDDLDPVVRLMAEIPGGLALVLGDARAAERLSRTAFLDGGGAFGFGRMLVAEDGGHVVGEMVRFTGSEWSRLRVRTGLRLLGAAGPRLGWRLLWRGAVAEGVVAPIPPDVRYVMSLAVRSDRRSEGIGAHLLGAASREAEEAGLRATALDVAVGNDAAIRFYLREGFRTIAERRHPAMRGLPAGGSIRMERRV